MRFVLLIWESAPAGQLAGMTMKQLAKGFRTLQLLKALGITDESEDIDIDSDLNSLTFFINEIYKNVKNMV
jgi:hypothetical protein